MTSTNKLSIGFKVSQHEKNQRLQVITLSKKTVKKFVETISQYNVQSIEYKPFLRFYIANSLNQATNNTLGNYLLKTIKNRSTGAVLLECESMDDSSLNGTDFIVFPILIQCPANFMQDLVSRMKTAVIVICDKLIAEWSFTMTALMLKNSPIG